MMSYMNAMLFGAFLLVVALVSYNYGSPDDNTVNTVDTERVVVDKKVAVTKRKATVIILEKNKCAKNTESSRLTKKMTEEMIDAYNNNRARLSDFITFGDVILLFNSPGEEPMGIYLKVKSNHSKIDITEKFSLCDITFMNNTYNNMIASREEAIRNNAIEKFNEEFGE